MAEQPRREGTPSPGPTSSTNDGIDWSKVEVSPEFPAKWVRYCSVCGEKTDKGSAVRFVRVEFDETVKLIAHDTCVPDAAKHAGLDRTRLSDLFERLIERGR